MKIVYLHDTGMVSITVEIHDDVSPEIIAQQWMQSHNNSLAFSKKAQSEGEIISYHFIEDDAVTSELNIEKNRYRTCATYDNGQVVMDMSKARSIHMNYLRELRKPKFEVLDIEYQKADEQNDVIRKAEIALLKQTLRDIPQDYDLTIAENVTQLIDLIPNELKS